MSDIKKELAIKPKKEKLTPKQAQFVIEYLVDMNGSQAAIRSGYSEDTSKEIASQNLTKPHIMNAIQEQMDARAERTLITADWVLQSLKNIHDRCVQDKPVMHFDYVDKCMVQDTCMIEDEDGNMKEVGVYEFDSAGANKAIELIGKHLKLFTDRMEMGNLDGSNFTFPALKEVFVDSPQAALEEQTPVPETNEQ